MKKSILFIFFLFYFSTSVFGQITVKGKIVDENGNLILRTVIIQNSDSIQTIINRDGTFEIEAKSKNDTLIFSSIDYDSQKIIVNEIINDSIVILDKIRITPSYKIPFTIYYWSGIFYNPYGIAVSKGWYFNKKKRITTPFSLGVGYSTNFKNNSDFYGAISTYIGRRYLYYIFQQTTFNKSQTKNQIATHFLESSSYLKFIKTGISYGIGHQLFSKKGLENDKYENFGISLGLFKKIKYIGDITLTSFYWQDYWAWEGYIGRTVIKKIRINILYRQTTQDFKEINLRLQYTL